MRHDEPGPDPGRQVDRLGRRHVARDAPRRVPAVDRQEQHVERPGAEPLGQAVVGQAVAAMIEPQPLGLDDEPQIKMMARLRRCRAPRGPTGSRGRGTRPARRTSPASMPDEPVGRQPERAARAPDQASGTTRTAPGEAAIRSGSVPGSRWSECLWLARTRSTPRRSPPADRRPRHPDVRPVGPLVLPRQVLGEIRVDASRPVRDLMRKPLWPSHQTSSDPGAGRGPLDLLDQLDARSHRLDHRLNSSADDPDPFDHRPRLGRRDVPGGLGEPAVGRHRDPLRRRRTSARSAAARRPARAARSRCS